MSYLNALNRSHDRQRSLQRAAQRNAKQRALQIVALEPDDCDAFADFDENEALTLRERNATQRELF